MEERVGDGMATGDMARDGGFVDPGGFGSGESGHMDLSFVDEIVEEVTSPDVPASGGTPGPGDDGGTGGPDFAEALMSALRESGDDGPVLADMVAAADAEYADGVLELRFDRNAAFSMRMLLADGALGRLGELARGLDADFARCSLSLRFDGSSGQSLCDAAGAFGGFHMGERVEFHGEGASGYGKVVGFMVSREGEDCLVCELPGEGWALWPASRCVAADSWERLRDDILAAGHGTVDRAAADAMVVRAMTMPE